MPLLCQSTDNSDVQNREEQGGGGGGGGGERERGGGEGGGGRGTPAGIWPGEGGGFSLFSFTRQGTNR